MNNDRPFKLQDDPSVPRELRALVDEVKKYSTAEEFANRNVISVDPRKLEPSQPPEGEGPSVSEGPVDIYLDKDTGAMIIEDGHHRVSEAIARGEQTIDAHVTVVETDPEEDGLACDVTTEFFDHVRGTVSTPELSAA
jgi:hypothetical protein